MRKELYVDERGKVIDPDDERERTSSRVKKRKRSNKSKEEQLEKIREEEKPKKRRSKTRRKGEGKVDLTGRDGPATDKQLAKVEKRKVVVERELNTLILAEPGDEFDRQYRKMFESLQVIIERFEERMENPSGRDVYALSTLYSQMREVIADIRSSKDIEGQMAELEARAYGGFLKAVGQELVNLLFATSRDIRTHVKDVDLQQQLVLNLESSVKDKSDAIMESYRAMLDTVRQVLS